MTWRLLRLTSMRLFVSLFVHHFKWESNAEPVRKLNNREPDLHVIIDISVVKESNHTQSLHHWELITVSAALVADMRQRRSYWCGADPARDGGGREICDNRSDEIGCQTSACDYSLSYEKLQWYTLFSDTWYHWFQSYVINPHWGLYINCCNTCRFANLSLLMCSLLYLILYHLWFHLVTYTNHK